ncbi:MFS transporter [Sphingobacterium chungjuense]|uniref:MFS transporter n=1 Tax=Sphingobacterium chungjuense TaxID=2675553 RepID=UPI00140DF4DE|nr:sugar MFS transporter [Sphingobacterium chungjuense]
MRKQHSIWPYAIVTFIYFIVGFLTTVNEQLQAPLKVTFLKEAGSYSNTLTTSISFFFFLGYLINSTLGSKWVNRFGYKNTIIRGLLFIISGLCFYMLSTWVGLHYPHYVIQVSDVVVPYGFIIFIMGSFLMGTSAAVIQVVVNPYVASYELAGTNDVQRLNITTGINSIGTTSAPFFVTVIMFSGISIESIQIQQLLLPLAGLIFCVLVVTLFTLKIPIPDIADTRSTDSTLLPRSMWSFQHFALGVAAIFFYVGTEVAIGANLNLYAFELLESGYPVTFFGSTELIIAGRDLGIHALLSTLYWGGFLVGRLASSFLKNVSARNQLIATTSLASILVVVAMVSNNIWFLVAIGLLHSSMWSCIYSLSIKGLKQYTSKASGIFISAVFGGAVFTLLQGGLADWFGSWRWTWTLSLVCELLMLGYALVGSRPREQDIIS